MLDISGRERATRRGGERNGENEKKGVNVGQWGGGWRGERKMERREGGKKERQWGREGWSGGGEAEEERGGGRKTVFRGRNRREDVGEVTDMRQRNEEKEEGKLLL